jgi:hypothetical protein
MRATRVIGLLTVTAALWACSDESDGASASRSPDGIDHPTGADEIVVQIATGGGFVPFTSRLAEVPEVTVYGDGRIVMVGPTTLEFPGAALPNLQEGRLTEDEVQELLRAAERAGLLDPEPPQYGEPLVTDLPTTVVTVAAGGDEHRVAVYALDYQDDTGLSREHRDARRRLRDLVRGIDADAVDRRYRPEAMAVFVRPGDAQDDADSTGARPPPAVQEWPLGDLAGAGDPYGDSDPLTRCLVVSSADLDTVLAAAEQATAETRWASGGNAYALVFRPLLPDEHGCDDLEPVRDAGA